MYFKNTYPSISKKYQELPPLITRCLWYCKLCRFIISVNSNTISLINFIIVNKNQT